MRADISWLCSHLGHEALDTKGADRVMTGGSFHGMEEEGLLESLDLVSSANSLYTTLYIGQPTQPWISICISRDDCEDQVDH